MTGRALDPKERALDDLARAAAPFARIWEPVDAAPNDAYRLVSDLRISARACRRLRAALERVEEITKTVYLEEDSR